MNDKLLLKRRNDFWFKTGVENYTEHTEIFLHCSHKYERKKHAVSLSHGHQQACSTQKLFQILSSNTSHFQRAKFTVIMKLVKFLIIPMAHSQESDVFKPQAHEKLSITALNSCREWTSALSRCTWASEFCSWWPQRTCTCASCSGTWTHCALRSHKTSEVAVIRPRWWDTFPVHIKLTALLMGLQPVVFLCKVWCEPLGGRGGGGERGSTLELIVILKVSALCLISCTAFGNNPRSWNWELPTVIYLSLGQHHTVTAHS
jgi:hypothetical protein